MKHIFLFTFLFFSLCADAQQKKPIQPVFDAAKRPKNLSDSALLDLVQKQTFRYFWDFAHPVSGMARERSNTAYYGHEVVTTGGTGFGIMSIIVATERGWISRDTAAGFMRKMVNFLLKANSYHGVFPHWLDGATGKTIPFSRKDDGADLVETSFLFQGLLCARQYFNQDNPVENEFRNKLNWLWTGIEWNWFTRDGQDVLYWHWSPNNGWAMNFPVRGFNECLIMYILAASDEKHYPVSASVYHRGWVESNFFKNGKQFYGHTLPLGFDYGGPLFFSHYSFLGLNPKGLKDRYADYWQQNVNHTLINHDYCVENPKKFKGYNDSCWGLTASDTYNGYDAHSPTNDHGTITPTAALSSFPYTPELSMKALKHFYYNLGDKIWGEYGFTDAFNETQNWYSKNYLAIDQGPIIVMIENYRSGLLWNLFMSCPEIKYGLKKLGFESKGK
ncbi:beta-glucosidase [Terrimonas sp.]|uniref:glucoamylase family protein n=1 Tax=Terrimonas sp. TaxID=1914338 RepID=UPI000D50C212|nr:glucoamylase family protein [Terrimonas sp.]PVD52670.1 beta-glucosidase [Terrimonas sp.]